jgi:hypothetical protein
MHKVEANEYSTGCEPFATDHLYLAAFLVCRGHRVVTTTPGERGRVFLRFGDSADLRSTVADFMSGGTVEARQFSFVLLKLKRSLPRY